MSAHHCHAKCGRSCPPAMLMCRWCWRMVPPGIQRMVYRYFNPDCPKGKASPSGAWMIAADSAILAVQLAKGERCNPVGELGLAVQYAKDCDEVPGPKLREALASTPWDLGQLRGALTKFIYEQEPWDEAEKVRRQQEAAPRGPAHFNVLDAAAGRNPWSYPEDKPNAKAPPLPRRAPGKPSSS